AGLLTGWIDPHEAVELRAFPAWKAVRDAAGADPLAGRLEKQFADKTVHPAFSHGDFAPWNIKVSSGRWCVLDWERGYRRGPPAWDWFHFVLQPAMLVEKLPTPALVDRAEALLGSVA